MRVDAEVVRADEDGLVEIEARIPAKVVGAHLMECLADVSAEHSLEGLTDHGAAVDVLGVRKANYAIIQWFSDRTTASALQVLERPIACAPELETLAHFDPDEDLVYGLRTYLLPKGTLASAEPVEVDAFSAAAMAARVDERLHALVRKHAERVSVLDARAARMGDVVELDVRVSQNGVPLMRLLREHALLKMEHGSMPAGFLDGVCGLCVGEAEAFSFTAPGPAGSAVAYDAEVCIHGIYEMRVPEISDAWVAKTFPDMLSVATLRAAIEESLIAQGPNEMDDARLAEDALLGRLDIMVPDALLGFAAKQARKERSKDAMRRDISLMAALDALFSERLMLVTKEDVDAVLDVVVPEEDVAARQRLILSGQMPLIEEQARREKAHRWLIETMVRK